MQPNIRPDTGTTLATILLKTPVLIDTVPFPSKPLPLLSKLNHIHIRRHLNPSLQLLLLLLHRSLYLQ